MKVGSPKPCPALRGRIGFAACFSDLGFLATFTRKKTGGETGSHACIVTQFSGCFCLVIAFPIYRRRGGANEILRGLEMPGLHNRIQSRNRAFVSPCFLER